MRSRFEQTADALLCFIGLPLLILFVAWPAVIAARPLIVAQEPRANASPTPMVTPPPEVKLPAIVPLTVEDSAKIVDLNKDATISQLQLQNLQLQIEKAQVQLKSLNDDAQKKIDARNAIWQAALKKAGVPDDKLDQYDAVDPIAGSNIITFKLKTPPKK